jgi:hypothetical protein
LIDQKIPDSEDDKEDVGFRLAIKLGGVMKRSEEDPDEDLELFGTSPRVIGLILLLVTLFFPVGGVNYGYNLQLIPPILYSSLWIANGLDSFWFIFRPEQLLTTIWITVPLCTFNFLFIRQINRFFYGKTSRDIALMYGLLSMIVPSTITLALWCYFNFAFIITPIPIQFFAGIILLYKFREPEVISPWEGYYLDWSWWARLRHSIDDSSAEVINLTKLLKEHDADWLEYD